MPTNTQLVASLTPQTVPPDLVCVPGDMNLLLPLIAQFLAVNATTAEVDQNSTNSIAQQALETANIALTTAQAALAAIPAMRGSSEPLAIQTGDSLLKITWSPDMPNTKYAVLGTFYGTTAHPSAYFAFAVVDGTRAVGNCQIRFENIPASTSWSFIVIALPNS